MATTPKKFSVQQVFEILLQDVNTGAIIAYLDDFKQTNLINEATIVYPTGGRGNVYIGGGFGHSKRARIEAQKATFNSAIIAAQVGDTSITIGSQTDVTKYDVLTIATNGANTTFTALGTAGSEILNIYKLNSDGSFASTPYTQAATPTTGKFSYVPGTKKINFFAGDLADGTNIALAYRFNTGVTAQRIEITADSFPTTVKVVANGLVKDLCTGNLFASQITGIAQVDPNWNWDLQSGAEPSVENLKLEFVRTCSNSNKNLYTLTVYDEADAT